MKKRNPRTKARRLAHNNREYVLLSREASGDCLWCPPNHNENARGHHSQWGRKRACKRQYSMGKGRKRKQFYWWDVIDKTKTP